MKLKKNIMIYMIFVFFSNLNFMSYFLSMYILNKGYSLSIVSICFLIYQLSKFVFEIPTGFVSDKYSRKLSGIIGIVLLMTSYILLLSNHILIFFISFFLSGLGVTFISGSVESLFVDSIDHESLIKYNVVERLIFYSSLALATILGGVFIKYLGYYYTIIMDVIILSLTLALVCQLDEKPSKILSDNSISIVNVFKKLFENKVVFILLFIDFANAFAFVAVEDFYSAFLGEFGVSSNWIGFIMALQFLISALFGFFTTKISKWFSSSSILYIVPALRAVITIIIYIGQLPPIFIPLVFLLQLIMYAIYAPIKYQLFQKNIEPQIRSTILSLQSLAVSLGSILFYGVSSILGRIFSLSNLLIMALILTTIMLILASKMLKNQHINI